MENKKNNIFRVGDKVYDCFNGWGIIKRIEESGDYPLNVNFQKGKFNDTFTHDGIFDLYVNVKRLSFTEYDFVNGGFSQVRPK